MQKFSGLQINPAISERECHQNMQKFA